MDLVFTNLELENDLLKVSQCKRKNCDNRLCLNIKKDINDLEHCLKFGKLKDSGKSFFKEIINHSLICDSPKCLIPWCSFLTSKSNIMRKDQPEHINIIIDKVISYYDDCMIKMQFPPPCDEDSHFIKLTDNAWQYRYKTREIEANEDLELRPEANDFINWIESPVNNHDYQPELHNWPELVDKYTKAIMPKPFVDYEIQYLDVNFGFVSIKAFTLQMHCEIKEFSCFEYHEMANNLRKISHINIVDMIWACVSNNLLACSIFNFDQMHLNEVLDISPDGTLPLHAALKFSSQLLSAASYLHDRNILYLLWTAESFLLIGETAYIYDLSSLVPLNFEDDEDRDLYVVILPPYVLPPEAIEEENKIFDEKTIIWGVGSLLHEMIYGQHLFYAMRHEPIEYQHRQIRQLDLMTIQQKLDCIDLNIRNIFQQIFSNYEERISMSQLQSVLEKYK